MTIPSPAFSESSPQIPVKTGSSKLPALYSFLYNSFNVATNSFHLIFLSGFSPRFEEATFSCWNETVGPKLPNLPHVSCSVFVRFWFLITLLSLFLALQVYSQRIFSPSNIRISPPLQLRLLGFSFPNRVLRWGGLRHPSNTTRSSHGRSGRPNSTHRYYQVFWRHSYQVCDLSTINVVPVWIPRTPMLSLLSQQSTHTHQSTYRDSSMRSQHAFHVRKPTGIETSLLPPPPKQPITSNGSKNWKRWSSGINCLGLQSVPIALFVRRRNLDKCQVAVSSRKADFLSWKTVVCRINVRCA